LALLSGCVPPGAATSPEPTATFVAPYATDEEALAAAEEAYAEYTRVLEQILLEGGVEPERLEAAATGDFLTDSIEGLREFEAVGYRSTGETEYSNYLLQRYSPNAGPLEVVSIYLCSDVSGVDIQDASGKSVVDRNREDLATMQVSFSFDETRDSLLITDQQLWKSGEC